MWATGREENNLMGMCLMLGGGGIGSSLLPTLSSRTSSCVGLKNIVEINCFLVVDKSRKPKYINKYKW